MPFAGAIADRYPEPARTADVFFERVKELIPNPDEKRVSDAPTLFELLNSHHAFDGMIPHAQGGCPGIPLTGIILEQWGRQLATDPVYQKRFLTTLTGLKSA